MRVRMSTCPVLHGCAHGCRPNYEAIFVAADFERAATIAAIYRIPFLITFYPCFVSTV
jgi:hypothetical protein